jgi:hypothetical protein
MKQPEKLKRAFWSYLTDRCAGKGELAMREWHPLHRKAVGAVALMIALLCVGVSKGFAAAKDESWFRIENGRPVYTREHEPGLSPDYGVVGKDGLVWHARLDGTLEAEYIDPGNTEEALKMEAEFGRWGREVNPQSSGQQFVEGVLGKAFFAPAGEGNATAYFTGLEKFTPLKRGSLTLWMKTDDASIYVKTFNIFSSGAGGLRHGTWAPHHLTIQDGGGTWHTSPYLVGFLTNDIKGWNMFAYTWDEKAIKVYVNGVFIAELARPVGTREWKYFSFGRHANQAPRAYDEVAFYNRILSQSEIRRQYLAMLRPMSEPKLSVPRTASPVKIDGVLDEKEWMGAAKVKGFLEGAPTGDFGSGQLAEPQEELMVQYDDEFLYIACRSPWPKEILDSRVLTTGLTGALKKVASERDKVDPTKEDAFELLVSADGEKRDGVVYRLLVNGQNVMADGRIAGTARGLKTDFSWNSNWPVVAKEAEIEGVWMLEAAIPFADIGVTAKPEASLSLNVARHWNLLQKGSDEWAWGTRRLESLSVPGEPFARGRGVANVEEAISFGELQLAPASAPAVSVVSLGDLLKGEMDFRAEVFNPGGKPVEVECSLHTSTIITGQFAPGFVLKREKIQMGPKERKLFEHSQKVDKYGDNMLLFDVRLPGSTQALIQNKWHFIRTETLDIYIKKLPTAGKVVALVNCGLLAGYEPAALRGRIRIADARGEALISVTSGSFSTYSEAVELDVSELAPGQYTLSVEVLAGEDVVAAEEQQYTQHALPDWLGNEYGWHFEEVPAPFTPVERRGDTLKAWGREYKFEKGVLPARIGTQGMDLLRAPVNLRLTLADGTIIETDTLDAEITWNDKPSVTVVRQKDGQLQEVKRNLNPALRAEGTATTSSNGIAIANDFWFEYDGLLWNTVSIKADKDVAIREAVLEVPMTKLFSHDCYPGGAVPEDGSSRTLQWIGNGYGGLQPVVRSAPRGAIKTRLEPSSEGATYRIVLIDAETPISACAPLEFSLQATPVKPRYPDHRRQIWSLDGMRVSWDIAGWYPQDQVFVPAPDNYYTQLIYDFNRDNEGIRWRGVQRKYERYDGWQKKPDHHYSAVYFTNSLNISVPEGPEFKDEWLASPRGDERVAPSDSIIPVAAAALSVRDYYLWRYGRLMDEIPYASMYFDGQLGGGQANPVLRNSPGTMQPLLGARELAKRLYDLVKIPHPDGIMFDHWPGNVDMALKSFMDFGVDGEQLWPRHKEGMRNFKGVMDVNEYRVKFMGYNYGLVGNWDLKLGNKPFLRRKAQRQAGSAESLAEHAESLALLHDSSSGGWVSNLAGEYHQRLLNVLTRYNWGPDYLMIPYWDQHMVDLAEGMYASFFVEPADKNADVETVDAEGHYIRSIDGPAKRVICIFSNESDWRGVMRVKPDWKALGFNSLDGVTADNAVHRLKVRYTDPEAVDSDAFYLPEGSFVFEENPNEYAKIENGELVFPMTEWNYRMIVLEKER